MIKNVLNKSKSVKFFRWSRCVATLSYVVMIVVLNTLFMYMPLMSLFGQSFSSADMFVGSIYIVRDFAQREIKHYIFIAMLVGAIISYLFASKVIALASTAAFVAGEAIDWSIFTFSKKPVSQRLIWSSMISSPIDSIVFLSFAERLHGVEFVVMTVGKMAGVLLLWLVWKWVAIQKKRWVGYYDATEITRFKS